MARHFILDIERMIGSLSYLSANPFTRNLRGVDHLLKAFWCNKYQGLCIGSMNQIVLVDIVASRTVFRWIDPQLDCEFLRNAEPRNTILVEYFNDLPLFLKLGQS